MQLNPDCIRDILLTVEEHSLYARMVVYDNSDNFPRLSKYTSDELFYHFNQCRHMNYFLSANIGIDTILAGDLSPKAHEFLANIRQDKSWKYILKKAANVGFLALPIIEKIAEAYAASKI